MIRRYLTVSILLLTTIALSVGRVWAQDSEVVTYTGTIDNGTPSKNYIVTLEAGEAILLTVEATSRDLDPTVRLTDPTGEVVAENDDRNDESLDSALGYVAEMEGDYVVTVSRYQGEAGSTRGNFRLEITTGDESIFVRLNELTGITLSGPTLTLDTEHFRIHYTLQGRDRVTEDYLQAVAHALEHFHRIEVVELGWAPPPSDGYLGGSPLYDVYIKDLIGRGEGALGYTSMRMLVRDNPNTEEIETRAAASMIAIDNDYRDTDAENNNPLGLMRATVAHEYHHAIQFGYDYDDAHNWYYEATASWMEVKAAGKEQDATGYVEYAYDYPELCFGTDNDPQQGSLMYGEWTFLDMLEADFGDTAVRDLWRNLIYQDGFAALGEMLSAHGETVVSTLARYRLRNLARDYELAPQFNATVWRENVINELGRWSHGGRGVQELGANYFEVTLPSDVYYFGMINDGGALELWAVGVSNRDNPALAKLDAIPLGRGGSFNTAGYDSVYLMVFNPMYDENVTDCTYTQYSIDVTAAKSARNLARYSFDARYFEPLGR